MQQQGSSSQWTGGWVGWRKGRGGGGGGAGAIRMEIRLSLNEFAPVERRRAARAASQQQRGSEEGGLVWEWCGKEPGLDCRKRWRDGGDVGRLYGGRGRCWGDLGRRLGDVGVVQRQPLISRQDPPINFPDSRRVA